MTDFKAKLAKVQSCTIKNGMLHNGDISDVPVRYLDAQAVEALFAEMASDIEFFKNAHKEENMRVLKLQLAYDLMDKALEKVAEDLPQPTDEESRRFVLVDFINCQKKFARETRERVKEMLGGKE